MTNIQNEFSIPEANWAKFEAQIAKLSKRSEKLVGMPIKPFVFGYEMKEDPTRGHYKVLKVYLTAETPKVDGWTFVARLDHSQEAGTMIRAVPNTGLTIPERFRNCEPNCEHCNVRRARRDTFLLCEDATGNFKQVGSTCLVDFFGHDPYAAAKYAELLGYAVDAVNANASIDTMGRQHIYADTEEVLQNAALMIRQYGWVSTRAMREAADEGRDILSTRNRVDTNMDAARRNIRFYEPITDEDRAVAAAALAWAQDIPENTDSDYLHNVRVVANSPAIEYRAVGIAVSIVAAYIRETQPRAQAVELGSMDGILALFDKAKSKLKNPAIVLSVGDDTIRLSIAGEKSRFPGTVNVTSEGSYEDRQWYGRVHTDGKYEPSKRTLNVPEGLTDALVAFAADPAGVAASHGIKTGYCCFCNKALKDVRSTEVGYGKTCAKNFELPWGATPPKGKTRKAKPEVVAEVNAVVAPERQYSAREQTAYQAAVQWVVNGWLPQNTVLLAVTPEEADRIAEILGDRRPLAA